MKSCMVYWSLECNIMYEYGHGGRDGEEKKEEVSSRMRIMIYEGIVID